MIPLILAWDENMDIGSDTGTPVNDKAYKVPFAFTGTHRQPEAGGRSPEAERCRQGKAGSGDDHQGLTDIVEANVGCA